MMRVNAANTPGLELTNIKIRVLKHLLLVVSLFNQTNTNKQIFQDDNTDRLTDTMTYQEVIFTNKLTLLLNLFGFRQNLNKNDKM